MKRGQAGRSLVFTGLLVLAAASCDDGGDFSAITAPLEPTSGEPELVPEPVPGCVPGQVRACSSVCGAPLSGYQVCAEDGRSYGECQCTPSFGTGPLFTGDRQGRRLVRLFPPPRSAPPVAGPPLAGEVRVGAECITDRDCGFGLRCYDALSDSLGGGGPAGGYCSLPCSTAADCANVDANSGCGALGGEPLCIRLCEAGPSDPTAPKCLGRDDLTCVSLLALGDEPPAGARNLGICAPRCGSDSDCGGRRCDLGTGLCMDEVAGGAPLGAACDSAAECASGVCGAPSTAAARFCSAFCTLGVPGCGFDGSEPKIGAACVLPIVAGEGDGDRGLCLELCDTADDCLEPGSTCVAEPTSGRAGVCVRPALAPPPGTGEEGTSSIGAPCETDADCADGSSCLSVDSDPFGAGGGPPGGYCSAPCASAADCGSGNACLGAASGGLCLRACTLGDDESCGDRDSVVCTPIGTGAVCLPLCSSNAECGTLRCNPALGLCVDAEVPCSNDGECADDFVCDGGACVAPPLCASDADCPSGFCDTAAGVCSEPPLLSVGAACSDDAACAGGLCLPLAGSSFCSAVCQLGTRVGCEPYGADAFCLLPVNDEVGLCLELCNTADDCAQTSYDCAPLNGTLDGRSGACLPPPAPAAP